MTRISIRIFLWCNMSSTHISCSTRFLHRHGDAELTSLIQATVPPADVNKVSMFQSHLEKYHQQDWIFVMWKSWIVPIPFHPLLFPVVPPGSGAQNEQSRRASQLHWWENVRWTHSQVCHYIKTVDSFVLLRLNAALLATTWSQTELQIEEDLSKLRTWAASFHLFASQQAYPDKL